MGMWPSLIDIYKSLFLLLIFCDGAITSHLTRQTRMPGLSCPAACDVMDDTTPWL